MLVISSTPNTGILSMWRAIVKAGEMTVWSGVLAALPEVLVWFPEHTSGQLTTACDTSSRMPFSVLHGHSRFHTPTQTCNLKIK